MDTLTAIFGSQPKVKLLRLFLFNDQTPFFVKEITARTKCGAATVRKELNTLVKADVLKKKFISKDVDIGRGTRKKIKKTRGMAYVLNDAFAYRDLLKNLL